MHTPIVFEEEKEENNLHGRREVIMVALSTRARREARVVSHEQQDLNRNRILGLGLGAGLGDGLAWGVSNNVNPCRLDISTKINGTLMTVKVLMKMRETSIFLHNTISDNYLY